MAEATPESWDPTSSPSIINAVSPPPDLTEYIIKTGDRYLAGGAFGDVYKCRCVRGSRQQEVAVKALRFKSTLDGETENRSARMLRRELGIWKRLNHNNIVPFLGIAYGFGMEDVMSLVSLWMPNETLRGFLMAHDDKLNTGHRLQILRDVSEGLHYLHSFPIVHGDLNPNNVLLDADYTARLTDFGYASLVGSIPEALAYLQRSTTRPGALRWIAPEQIDLQGSCNKTTKSDIYSLGCIALQGSPSSKVLSGKQPWSEVRRDAAVVLHLHLGHKPGRPESRAMDDSQWNFIQRCWLAVQDRPTTDTILPMIEQLLNSCRPFKPLHDLLVSSSSRVQDQLVDGLSASPKNPSPAEGPGSNETPPDNAKANQTSLPTMGPSDLQYDSIPGNTHPAEDEDTQRSSSSMQERPLESNVTHARPQSPPVDTRHISSQAQEGQQRFDAPRKGPPAPQQPIENGRGSSFRTAIVSQAARFKPDPNDLIIMVMGPTGSGKTNFIHTLIGNVANLGSAAQTVTPYTVHRDGLRLVLFDTPAFGDTYQSDMEILQEIANLLTMKYPDGDTLRLTGVIYLHRITDNRMSASVYKNLQMFSRVCGNIPLRRVRLVTTMWDKAKDTKGLAMAEGRETELLNEFWQPLISEGAVPRRFNNQPRTALQIVNELIESDIAKDELLLQEEIVEQQKRINETEAGKALYSRFQQLLAEQRRVLKELADEARLQNDPTLASSLQMEYDQVNAQLQQTFEEMKSMKIPFTRRFILWLFGGKSRGRAVDIA